VQNPSKVGVVGLLTLTLSMLAGCGGSTDGGSTDESSAGEIAYSVDRAKPRARIVVVRDDGTGARRVTAARRRTNAWWPVWSPDGTKIAFMRSVPEGLTSHVSGLTSHVSVVNADGTGERRLGEGGGQLWTRDGTALLVERRGGIYLVDVGGSGERLLASGTAPALSHDGSKLAFLRYTEREDEYGCCVIDASALFTVSLDGDRLRRLASTSGHNGGYHLRAPVWLADDREIAVVAKDDITGDASLKVVSESGQQRVIVKGVGDDFEWSPGGDRLAYSRPLDRVLYVARGDGSEAQAFATPGEPQGLRWSPDGEKIAFYVDARDDPENVREIYVLDADDGDRRRIARVRGYGVDLAWRPAED
jgi:Tol biopolymer transport system component